MKQILYLALTITSLSSCSGFKSITSSKKNFDFPAYADMGKTDTAQMRDTIYSRPEVLESRMTNNKIAKKEIVRLSSNPSGEYQIKESPGMSFGSIQTTNTRAKVIDDWHLHPDKKENHKSFWKKFLKIAAITLGVILIAFLFVLIIGLFSIFLLILLL